MIKQNKKESIDLSYDLSRSDNYVIYSICVNQSLTKYSSNYNSIINFH